jgi:hypothetical protein
MKFDEFIIHELAVSDSSERNCKREGIRLEAQTTLFIIADFEELNEQ